MIWIDTGLKEEIKNKLNTYNQLLLDFNIISFWNRETLKSQKQKEELKQKDDRILELTNINTELKNKNRELKDRYEKVENIFRDLQTLFNKHVEIRNRSVK
ncbi:MAG: hypothetical protein H8D97_01785 [Proteobacteria bacterium]|nr:hypothetical protein [Pseudomonadota bacterium]